MGVVPGTTLFDHAPVLLTLDSAAQSLAPRSCRIPDSIFSREEVRSRIGNLWDRDWGECDDLAEAVAQALQESSQICQQAALQVRQEWWGRERALRRDLASIQRLQQTAPGSEELRLQALRAKALLEETLLRRSEFSYHASLSYWARKGDRMSREFFWTHGHRAAGDYIRSLGTIETHLLEPG